MINRNAKANQTKRKHVEIDGFILPEDANDQNSNQWLHTDPLIPAEDTGWKFHDFTKKETTKHCDKRLYPSNIEQIFLNKLHAQSISDLVSAESAGNDRRKWLSTPYCPVQEERKTSYLLIRVDTV